MRPDPETPFAPPKRAVVAPKLAWHVLDRLERIELLASLREVMDNLKKPRGV